MKLISIEDRKLFKQHLKERDKTLLQWCEDNKLDYISTAQIVRPQARSIDIKSKYYIAVMSVVNYLKLK